MDEITGDHVRLRPVTAADKADLVAIRQTPEVFRRWRGSDLEAEFAEDLRSADLHVMAIVDAEGTVIGAIQWQEEEDPDYRHASIDIYLHPSHHGRGLCTDAVRTLVRYLIEVHGLHRLVIDPAADNIAAIRCYEKAGFRPVGVMRQYERGNDGSWHDGLLMDLLADDVASPTESAPPGSAGPARPMR
jgi:aminoglycoside 6'-N-acetyltransferase